MMRYDIQGIPDDAAPGIYPTRIGALEIQGDDIVIPLVHDPDVLPEQSYRPVVVGV